MADLKVARVAGRGCVLRGDDIDTDRIIPARFLRCVTFDGIGEHAFEDDRRQAKGDHPLDDRRFEGARILLVGRNFGCGSSREHAPWALVQHGFRAILAPSFADIFYNNSLKNGLLVIALPELSIDRLFHEVAGFNGYRLTIDLPQQKVIEADGAEHAFDIAPFRKYCLLNGFDDIGLTLRHADKIRQFEAQRLAQFPWLEKKTGR
jgi:3-isopropylmalate/(R)-2-methylmalate dehydratase small subunit